MRALPFRLARTYKRGHHTTSAESDSVLPTQGMGFMTFDFRAARLTMVESQVRTSDVTDTDLQDAMRTVPRERFCPEGKLFLAYAETEIEYAPGQYLMAPRDIAKLLQLLKPRSGERALAIAAPYAAAVLRQMGLQVTEQGPNDAVSSGAFDVIVTEGAVDHVPQSWLKGLSATGRLGAVERSGPVGKAKIHVLSEDGFGARDGFDASCAYLAGFEPKPSFAF